MKFYDLFAGIGGFRLALERNGHECVGSCEKDKYANQIYEKNFGHQPEEKDATKIRPEWLPDFDILCAGFPCQAFSYAGKKLGFEDTRGTLFFDIIRIAREKRPKYLLLENVKGLLTHDKGRTFATMLNTLDEIRYEYQWQVVNSKYHIPQNRERVIIVGYSREGGGRKILPVGDYGEEVNRTQNGPKGEGQRIRSKNTGTIMTGKGDCTRGTFIAEKKITGALDANYFKGGTSSRTFIAEPKIKMLKNSSEDCYRIYDVEGIARTLRANAGGMGAKTGIIAEPRIIADRSRTKAGLGRRLESPKKIANSLTSVAKDNLLLQNYRLRRLTPLECERLQSFPDNWTKGASDSQRYKMLGNAVTVDVIEYISSLMT